jgi:hypothetical protein
VVALVGALLATLLPTASHDLQRYLPQMKQLQVQELCAASVNARLGLKANILQGFLIQCLFNFLLVGAAVAVDVF